LKDRAITRDISWGVPVPVEGFESKRIYVWFDAVIGYLSATREWAQRSGDPEAWRRYWEDPAVKSYYFIGKDNIPFHTIIWPAMLMGCGGLNLPYDVPANQYVNFAAGQKQSKSKGTGTWVLDLLDVYDADVVRFYLASIMPETSDSEFREDELIRSNNEVLIATWGNLANRVISMVHRYFDGVVPDAAPDAPESAAVLRDADEAFERIGAELEAVRFRSSLQEALRLVQSGNRYLDQREPWRMVREDRAHVAETLRTALDVVSALAVLLHPFLPFSTERLWAQLGHREPLPAAGWRRVPVVTGQKLGQPEALYRKLDAVAQAP
ncbi:MAG: class I tRNA ligase family protein, partial [Chloroflexota bacterium]|nr:class I tRNA ligase family protein [Chloroflexota bacterium]